MEKNTRKQAEIKYKDNAYENTIPYTQIRIHCFYVSGEYTEDYTPELLEKEILTMYLKCSGNLPQANNEL